MYKSDSERVDEPAATRDNENKNLYVLFVFWGKGLRFSFSLEVQNLLRSKSLLLPTTDVFYSLLRIFDWAVTRFVILLYFYLISIISNLCRAFDQLRDLAFEDRLWVCERSVVLAVLAIRLLGFVLTFV